MEDLLLIDYLLALTFLATFGLEVIRYFLVRYLKLDLPGNRGYSYPYHLRFVAALATVGPLAATVAVWLLTSIWRWCLSLPRTWSFYASGAFLVALAALVAGLTYVCAQKIEGWKRRNAWAGGRNDRPAGFFKPLGLLTFLALFFFVVQPLRWGFGCILLALGTSVIGTLVNFTDWQDLARWLRSAESGQDGQPASARDRIRVRFFIDADGVLSRRGDRVELQGEEIAASDDEPVVALARRLLDRSRVTEIVNALEKLEQRDDLLAEIPPFIARNLAKLAAKREALNLGGYPAAESEARMEAEIRELFRQQFEDRLRSLLYWHYDFPDSGLHLAVTRSPHIVLKPMITFQEYLGLFLSLLARRNQC